MKDNEPIPPEYYLNGPDEFVNPKESTSAPVEKEDQCRRALQSLYIAVSESVASDVDNKVSAYVHQIKEENARLRGLIEELIPIAEEAMDYALGAGWSSDRDIGVIKRAKEQFKKDNNL